MKIGVVGLGYVGIVTAAVLADHGNIVVGINKSKEKSEMLSKGIPPLYEPGLKDILNKNIKNFVFSTNYSKLKDVDVVILIVPTPTVNERIDLSYILEAAHETSKVNKNAILVIKSTVVPGTAKLVSKETGMVVVSNPEFTKEGCGISDTAHPNRIIIGSADKASGDIIESIWSFTNAPVVRTNNENAELIKYASNSFLATKISFMNELANLCEKIPGCDIEVIAKGMGYDERISPHFLKAGLGFGGSCFPKDTKALASFAREKGLHVSIVEAAINVNEDRINHVIEQIREVSGGISNINMGILGAAFKENTDDVRESQAIKLIEKLSKMGAKVVVYDPLAKELPVSRVTRVANIQDCVKNADVIVVATEWDEFKDIEKYTGTKPIVDARRILDSTKFRNICAVGLGNK